MISIATPTIVDAGETISTPTPRAMTQPPETMPFITLTRMPVVGSSLPANADIVSAEQARLYDSQNAGEALSHEVGLQFQPKGASSYPLNASIRGASPNQTLVLIDGRPMEGVALGAADLSEIPLSQIDHIEIVRGGLSALYGPNALGGVINVITKRSTYTGYPISHVSNEDASYGRQTYKLDFGSRQGPVDYFFFGDEQWEHGFRGNADNSQYNVGGNAGISMGNAGKVLIDAGAFHNNAAVPGFRCDNVLDALCLTSTTPLEPNRFNDKDERPPSTPNAREVTDTSYLRASYLVNLPQGMSLATRLYGQEREVNYDDSADVIPVQGASTDRHEQSKGADQQLSLPLGLMIGDSFNYDREDFEDLITPSNSFIASEQNWGVFAQETLHWKAATLIPSGRYDQNSQFGGTSNPRVQGLLDAADWLQFSASGGRSFRAPTFDERMPVPSENYLGNPNLEPETAWTYDAGFELHESSKSFKANYFLANIQNTIQTFVPQDPADPQSSLVAVNLDRSRKQGLEVQISHVVNEYFRDSWNYTYLENLGQPAGFDHFVALAYSPRHTANYVATFMPSKKWEIDSTWRYEDARYSGNDNTGTKMGAQVIPDLRLAYEMRQLEIFLGVKDITDKRYEEVPGYPLPGITFYAGVRLRLWG